MSFQAKSTLVMLVAMVIAYGLYTLTIIRLAGDGPIRDVGYQPLIFIVVVPLVVVATIGHIIIAAMKPAEADSRDERDDEIARRGEVLGGRVLAVAVFGALAGSMAQIDHFWIAHLLLAGLVLAELADGTRQLVLYRRGF